MEAIEIDVEEDEESGLSLLEYLPPGVLMEIFKFLDWKDLCQVSSTCTKFNQISKSASIWLSLKSLDFRYCRIPDAHKILEILAKTPNAERLTLGDVITDEGAGPEYEGEETDSDMEQEGGASGDRRRDNLLPADRYVLSVIKACPQLTTLDIYMYRITDTAVEAVCAKCMNLQSLSLHENPNISVNALKTLVSLCPHLDHLTIESCEQLDFISLCHTEPSKKLSLKRICFEGLNLTRENLQVLVCSCPQLISLHVSGCHHLYTFTVAITQAQKTGLDKLEELSLIACEDLTEVTLPYCPNLIRLEIQCSGSVKKVTATCPLLKHISMSQCLSMEELELTSCDLEDVNCSEMDQLQSLIIGSSAVHTLNLSGCASLTTEVLMMVLPNMLSLSSLNITGCKNIAPADVNTHILTGCPGLQKLTYGGHSWNSIELASENLQQLHFSGCVNTAYIGLNMPRLNLLKLKQCRDFAEQDLFDYLLYGKRISRLQGLERLVTPLMESPFSGNQGIPALCDLQCHELPGLRGDVLSHSLVHFKHLTSVEIISCLSLAHVCVQSWPHIQRVKIESCNHLSKLEVRNVPTLQSLDVRWCSMVSECLIRCDSLEHLDTTGSNFSHLTLACDKLTNLALNGVCTMEPPQNTLRISCKGLKQLSITKCDRLGDTVLEDILYKCPNLTSISVIGSLSLRTLSLPSCISECSLTGHRVLKEIKLHPNICVKHLTLNNLPKLVPSERLKLLGECEATLRILEVRAIPGETNLHLSLSELHSLTLDQGIHLSSLEICCPKLRYLRIQGCPRLSRLSLQVERLAQVQVYHSTPLRNLQHLTLHCTHVLHLARVLFYYCPKIDELCLHGSNIKGAQIYRLCESLPSLRTLKLYKCSVKDFDKQLIETGDGAHTVIQQFDGRQLNVQFL